MYKNLLEGFDRAYGIKEDTIKTKDGKWANVGKDGKVDSGKFKTKKEADAQRKAMFARGFKEGLTVDNANNGLIDALDFGVIDARELAVNFMRDLTSDELVDFIRRYGYEELFTDDKNLDEKCSKKSLKKDDLNKDLAKYQKWVDYDMKRYGRISDNTQNYLKI